MKKYAAATLRHFIGQKTPFGTGECMLWEHRVEVDKLKYSKAAVTKVWNSPIIMLEDIINSTTNLRTQTNFSWSE